MFVAAADADVCLDNRCGVPHDRLPRQRSPHDERPRAGSSGATSTAHSAGADSWSLRQDRHSTTPQVPAVGGSAAYHNAVADDRG